MFEDVESVCVIDPPTGGPALTLNDDLCLITVHRSPAPDPCWMGPVRGLPANAGGFEQEKGIWWMPWR